MAKKLPPKDAVIIGLGWTGSILALELCEAGLSVAAIERGPWRDPTAEFTPTMAQDELRFRIRHERGQRAVEAEIESRRRRSGEGVRTERDDFELGVPEDPVERLLPRIPGATDECSSDHLCVLCVLGTYHARNSTSQARPGGRHRF